MTAKTLCLLVLCAASSCSLGINPEQLSGAFDAGGAADASVRRDGGAAQSDGGGCAKYVTGLDVRPFGALPLEPPLGMTAVDPAYGLTERRVTQTLDGAFNRHLPGPRQVFNLDNTKVLTIDAAGSLSAVDLTTFKGLSVPLTAIQEPTWSFTSPTRLMHFGAPLGGTGLAVWSFDLTTGDAAPVFDYGTLIKMQFSGATRMSTLGGGRPSNDGAVWCVAVENDQRVVLGLVALDLARNTILLSVGLAKQPVGVLTSPKGTHCIAAFDDATNAWPVAGGAKQKLSSLPLQDVALTADDRQVVIGYNPGTSTLIVSDLKTGVESSGPVLTGNAGQKTQVTLNATATARPGLVMLSLWKCGELSGAACADGTQWFQDKIVAFTLSTPTTLINLVSTPPFRCGANCNPDAAANADFTKLIFATPWRPDSETSVSSFVVDLPACAWP